MRIRSARRYGRRWLTSIWIAAFGVIPFFTGVWGSLGALGLLGTRTTPNYWAFGVAAGWTMVGIAAGVRSARVAIVATPGELIVRNFFATRRIPWTDVRGIHRPRPFVYADKMSGFVNLGNGLHIGLNDGSTVVATIFSPAGWDPPQFADDVIESLRQHATDAQEAPNLNE